jgi:hypothetical protein
MSKSSAKSRIKAFFLENKGKVVTAKQLQAVAEPVSEWARRVRELRDEEGWPIITNHDSVELKPGEYMLIGDPPEFPTVQFKRGISQRLKAEVLDRNGFTCQSCGLTPGDIDPETGRKVRLHVAHIVDKSLGGKDELSNLRTYCSSCNQGAKNLTPEKPSRIWLLSQIRRANIEDQRAAYEWLATKFGR